MKFGKVSDVINDMENGVYNFCKDGKCIGCGQCCSDLLPISSSEIKEIKRYIKKNNIKEHKHFAPTNTNSFFDLTCPFLDTTKSDKKCTIYKVRPKICRTFQCNIPPSKVEENKHLFWRDRKGVSMRKIFFESEV